MKMLRVVHIVIDNPAFPLAHSLQAKWWAKTPQSLEFMDCNITFKPNKADI